MAIVEFTRVPLPELSLSEPDEIREHFTRIMDVQLPGFVVRQAYEPTHPEAVRSAVHEIVSSVAALEESAETRENPLSFFREQPLSREDDSNRTDIGLHVDDSMAPHASTQINFSTITEGSMTVTLFRMQKDYIDAQIKSGPNASAEPDFELCNTAYVEKGRVSTRLVVPEAHTAEHLSPGDFLVFNDWAYAHDFRTQVYPRRSQARIFFAEPRMEEGRTL